jgi:DNA excision repair protein ERCC-4
VFIAFYNMLNIIRGAFLCIGGPALVWYVTPTEEEIFKVRFLLATCACRSSFLQFVQRYSPDLQKKALAGREQRQKDFDAFVGQLKEASRSDKPSKHLRLFSEVWLLTVAVWTVQKEMDAKRSEEEQQIRRDERDAYAAESRRRQAEIRASTQ